MVWRRLPSLRFSMLVGRRIICPQTLVGDGVVLDVAAVLLCFTGDVSVRAVAFGNCSNCCHDVFSGEQSDASCFVWHGGLRWWWCSSPWCWRVRSERRCRPLGLGVQSWPATCSGGLFGLLCCPARAAKKSGSFEPPIVGRFCPVVGHLNLTKICAITWIIARRTDVRKRTFGDHFAVLTAAVFSVPATVLPWIHPQKG